MTSPFSRHIACNRCRLRKVKCDGRRPWCRRCSGTGAEMECFYDTKGRSNRKRQDMGSYPFIDGTHFTSFDFSSDIDEITQSFVGPTTTTSWDEIQMPKFPTIQNLTVAMVESPGVDSSTAPYPNMHSATLQDHMTNTDSSCDLDASMCSLDLDVLDPTDTTEVLLSLDAIIGIESIPIEYLSEMYNRYFMTTHQTFPLINQGEFLSSVSTATSSHETLALRSAICAHGATVSPKFMTWAVSNLSLVEDQNYGHWFYQHAKYHLGKAENNAQESPSLDALQANLLLGLYEVKQGQFSEAWITTSRAAWAVQYLQHTKTRLPHHPSRQQTARLSPPSTSKTLAPVTDEERNAMWAVLHLNCFLSIGVRSNVIDLVAQNEIGATLPRQDELDSFLRLDDVLTKPHQASQLSPKQRLSITTILCTRTFYHIKMMNHADPLDRNPYNFWTQHYHLDGAIRHITSSDPGQTNGVTGLSIDANCGIIVSVLLKTTATCLHEALLAKAEREFSINGNSKQAIQAQSSSALTLQNSLDIAELVQTEVSTEEANIFLPWSIYVAIQSLLRHQRRHRNTAFLTNPAKRSDDIALASSNPGNCVHCGNISRSSSYDGNDTAGLLDDAVILDAISALCSSLLYLCNTMPLAQFFYDEAQVEVQRSDELADRVVGLATFHEC